MSHVFPHKYSQSLTLEQRLENIIYAQRKGVTNYCYLCFNLLNNKIIYRQFDLNFCSESCRNTICKNLNYLEIFNYKYHSDILDKEYNINNDNKIL